MNSLNNYIKENFSYDPETGILYRLDRGPKRAIGTKNNMGYLIVHIRNRLFLNHRVCWFLHFGYWPDDQLDHIDGNRLNNKISNLRSATNQQNAFNRKKHSNNTSGFTGVSYCKNINKYRAYIKYKYKHIHLGYFDTAENASIAYENKAIELFSDYKRKDVL